MPLLLSSLVVVTKKSHLERGCHPPEGRPLTEVKRLVGSRIPRLWHGIPCTDRHESQRVCLLAPPGDPFLCGALADVPGALVESFLTRPHALQAGPVGSRIHPWS